MSARKNVRIDKILLDSSTQPRDKMSSDHVADLVAAYEENYDSVPPIDVFGDDDSGYHVGDGFHRIEAATQLQFREVPAVVHDGGQREAKWHAAAANKSHGLRRTNETKRGSVLIILGDPEWAKMSNRAIAEHCGVTDPFVSGIRKELQVLTVSTSTQRTGRDGKSYPATQTPKTTQSANGKSLVDGVLVDDPPDVAEERAAGLIGPNVIPTIETATTPGMTPEEIEADGEAEEERQAIRDETPERTIDDDIAEMPLSQQLSGIPLRTFQSEVRFWFFIEKAREALKVRASEGINKLESRKIGSYAYRIRSTLSIKPPSEWVRCPDLDKGGCQGVGTVKVGSNALRCEKCKGDGYLYR